MNILNKLTIKHLKMNKKRTIVTIIGIILSTALMVGIGLLFSTFREYLIEETILYNGNYHTSLSDVPKNKLPIITNNMKIKNYFYSEHIGYAYLENGINEYKPYLNVINVNPEYFDELNLVSGRLPKNENEVVISSHIKSNGGVDYSIGEILNLEIGKRYLDDELVESEGFIEGETLKIVENQQYEIVGIVERSVYENYSEPGYSIFTINQDSNGLLDIYVRYKKINDTYKISEDIAQKIGFENVGGNNGYYKEMNYNDSLLAMYGISRYQNMIEGISGILAIILGLISVGCIIVIYNSFAISVMERKKQFGLFSSIGATKHQLRKTVFFEAFIVGTIGISLGLLAGFLGISIVIKIVNQLISGQMVFKMSAYPLFIIIPIIFMIIVIIFSAFIPARQASKITPIEAIRLNDDIKIKSKKLKTNKLVKKLFGIEGEIALKNIKRNKKKYRITIVALFISIVMFVTFSSFIDYIFEGVDDFTDMPEYEIDLYINNEVNADVIKSIMTHEQVENSIMIEYSYDLVTNTDFSKIYSEEYKKINNSTSFIEDSYQTIITIKLKKEDFKNYLNKLGYKESKPILLNIQKGINYTNDTRRSFEIKKYSSNDLDINLCQPIYNVEDENEFIENKCFSKLSNYYLGNKDIFGLYEYIRTPVPVLIISEDMQLHYSDISFKETIKIDTKKYDKLDIMIKNLDEVKNDNIFYVNYPEEMKLLKNATLAVKILIYGFISLVTLIGVTSVFNTINTSIALRRKEFAMLRSVGLTTKGFNKILYFESIFFGLKSLLYALPVSIGLIALIHLSMDKIGTFNNLILPIKSIIIAIFAVFIIVLITMLYSSNKVKKENILEAIREENI